MGSSGEHCSAFVAGRGIILEPIPLAILSPELNLVLSELRSHMRPEMRPDNGLRPQTSNATYRARKLNPS